SLGNHAGVPWPAGEGWWFDPDILRACLRQPPEWKQRFGFPAEVEQVLDLEVAPPSPTNHQPPAWQRVILDPPERLLAAVLVTAGEGGRPGPVGFAARQEGWALQGAEPAFTVREGWEPLFPELAEEPAPELWRQAWWGWCQPRGFSQDDANACTLERHGA